MQVEIRSHNTLFSLDEPPAQTPHGTDIVVLVYYLDTDLSIGIHNSSLEVRITVTSPGMASLVYSSTDSALGVGHYNITIPSMQWSTTGWKNLTISIEWIGDPEKYTAQIIETSVRLVGRRTDLYLDIAPVATCYLNNFTFTATFLDAVNSSGITNSTGNVYVTINPVGAGNPVLQADFEISELGFGIYEFRLNTTKLQGIGSFQIDIAFMWSSGVSPRYENQTMEVHLMVLARPTYVYYHAFVPSTPYGENGDLVFSFVDSLMAEEIPDSLALTIDLIETSVVSSLSYDPIERRFTLAIDTSTLGGVGIFELHLAITWTGNPFYSNVTSEAFSVTVNLRDTQLSHLPFSPPQWNNNVSIEFIYTDLVSGSSVGMTDDLTLNASLAGWYTVTPLGNGHYMLVLNTSGFASDGTYALEATMVYTGSYYAADAVEVFMFSVLKRSTQLGYDSPDPAPYLENVTFVILYTDDSTGVGISGASVTVDCSNCSSPPLVLNTDYWVTYIGGGHYRIEVDSQALGSVAAYILDVDISWSGAPYYFPASIEVNSRVVQRATQILITQTPGDTQFLENVTFELVTSY
jgi:hypothetical protein